MSQSCQRIKTMIQYQIISKLILSVIIYPIFTWIFNYFIQKSGRDSISSGDYLSFIFSFQGLGFLIGTLVLLVIIVCLDINIFIILSGLMIQGEEEIGFKEAVWLNFKSFRNLFSPQGMGIMIYIAVIVPLVGIGFTISPMKNFGIPNFIESVIFNNTLYTLLYTGLMIILFIITVWYIFTFHYLVLRHQNIKESLISSSKLMKRFWKEFLVKFLIKEFLVGVFGFLIIGVIILGAIFGIQTFVLDLEIQRKWLIFIIILASEIIGIFLFITLPYFYYRLTQIFYYFHNKLGDPIHIQREQVSLKKSFRKWLISGLIFIVMIIVIGFNYYFSAFYASHFDALFKSENEIQIIAHRGGGDLAAENSILGLKEAIKAGAAWSEIDVQRTKDGFYVINHDKDFTRVSGVSKTSQEMTLEEIKALKVKDLFDTSRESQPVATLEEFLEASQGKIGLMIELKGETADEQMVDEVVTMVIAHKMEKEVALLSLDYHLIQYIEEKYPKFTTGYLYFFAIGKTSDLIGDMLIMEEREAIPSHISSIQAKDKKAIVWTVNTTESIDQFVKSDVDGVITDVIPKVKEGLNRRDQRSDIELIVDNLLLGF